MATTVITPNEIRMFLMDRPELNTLIRTINFSTEEIDQAAISVIDYFNTISPQTVCHVLETFPYRYLLVIGVAGYLLRSGSINQALNHFAYSVDGVQIDDNAKAELFLRIGGEFWEEFKQLAQNIKVAQNISAAFGSVGSEYRYIVR